MAYAALSVSCLIIAVLLWSLLRSESRRVDIQARLWVTQEKSRRIGEKAWTEGYDASVLDARLWQQGHMEHDTTMNPYREGADAHH
jgi:hypothetical protein